MIDREKVIKGLEYHLKELSVGKTCFECPYLGDNPCEIQLIADAIILLRMPLPEPPIEKKCGNCEYFNWDRRDKPCCYCIDNSMFEACEE